MVKKFVIKPWMIIVASVVVIGGVSLFFVLNKGDESDSNPNKSSPKSKAGISTQQYKDYVTKTQEKIKKAMEAEEKCIKEKHPKTGKNYKSCEEKELAEIAKAELELLKEEEKVKEEKKGKTPLMTPAKLKALRIKAQRKAKQLVSRKRMASRPQGCAKVNKKGGCAQCEKGLFIDESGDCHGSTAECNYPFHMEHHDPKKKISQLISNEMGETLIPSGKARCVCPHIHTGTGTMHKFTNGVCQRMVKTKEGKLVYKNFSEEGDVPYYATNEDKKNAVNDKKLHPDFLEDPNFYQEEDEEEEDDEEEEEKEEEEEAKDWQGNKISWYKPDFSIKRDMPVDSSNKQVANEKIIKELKKKGVVQGKFYKKNGDKIEETTFSDKDPSVFYINGPSSDDKDCNGWCYGGLCHPNDKVPNKNIGRYCGGSGWFAQKKAVTKSNFVITPECVF